MYKRNAQGWSKHIDFMMLDIIRLQLCFIFSFFLRHHEWVYSYYDYRTLGLLLLFSDVLVIVVNNSLHDVIKRGYLREVFEHIKHSVYVLVIVLVYIFSSQLGEVYSRYTLGVTFILYILLGYCVRIFWKWVLRHTSFRRERNNMLVVVTEANAESILTRLLSDKQAGYELKGVVIIENTNLKSVC